MTEISIPASAVATAELSIPPGGHARLRTWMRDGGAVPVALTWSCAPEGGGSHVYPGPEFLTGGQVADGPWRALSDDEKNEAALGFRPVIFNEKTMQPVLDHKGLLPSGCAGGFVWSAQEGRAVAHDIRNGEESFELGTDGACSVFLEADGRCWIADLDSVTSLVLGKGSPTQLDLQPAPGIALHGVFVVGGYVFLWRSFGNEREMLGYGRDGALRRRWTLEPDPTWPKATASSRPHLVVGSGRAGVLQGSRLLSFSLDGQA